MDILMGQRHRALVDDFRLEAPAGGLAFLHRFKARILQDVAVGVGRNFAVQKKYDSGDEAGEQNDHHSQCTCYAPRHPTLQAAFSSATFRARASAKICGATHTIPAKSVKIYRFGSTQRGVSMICSPSAPNMPTTKPRQMTRGSPGVFLTAHTPVTNAPTMKSTKPAKPMTPVSSAIMKNPFPSATGARRCRRCVAKSSEAKAQSN